MDRRQFIAASAGVFAGGGLLHSAASGHHQDGRQKEVQAVTADSLHLAEFRSRRKFAALRVGSIAHLDVGTGPAALFLHGFPLNGFQWRHAIERLSMYRRCIVPDLMGLGHSVIDRGQAVDPDAQVGMLLALLDHLGVGDVDLIANDSGGAIAQLLLARHGARVRSLLLTNCDTEIDSPPEALLPVIALAKQQKWLDSWIAPWLRDKQLARSPEGIGGMCFADPDNPTDEAIEAYFAPMLATKQSRYLAHAYAIGLERNPLHGTGALLKASKVPVRVVWGMADGIFGPHNLAHLEQAFGNLTGAARLNDSKLFWPEERPDILVEEACKLWERCAL